MTISVPCRCGKLLLGSEDMAGVEAQCPLCRRMVLFPGLPGYTPVDQPEEAAQPANDAQPTPVVAAHERTVRDYLYWVLLLALLPLCREVIHDTEPSLIDRLARTVQAHPEVRQRVEELLDDPDASLDELLAVLPGRRLDDRAHLPRDSMQHWWYATAAALGYLLLLHLLFAKDVTHPGQLVLIGLFTSTIGVGLLFLIEGVLESSFHRALDPERSFLVNFFGFTCIVGLCEELCKALPLLWYIRRRERPTWQGACLWGMASGVGFGVAEGIIYSGNLYNGISEAGQYVVRFISCVALHAVWSASVGLTIFHCRRVVRRAAGAVLVGAVFHWQELLWPVLRVLGVAMVLHGLYDALLTKDQIAPALLVALCSFAWLGWQIETCRDHEGETPEAPSPPLAPARFADMEVLFHSADYDTLAK
jgi:RsiW-degrading membrane proteinase PrsW (M82 family)